MAAAAALRIEVSAKQTQDLQAQVAESQSHMQTLQSTCDSGSEQIAGLNAELVDAKNCANELQVTPALCGAQPFAAQSTRQQPMHCMIVGHTA